jgi:hypothetical protein
LRDDGRIPHAVNAPAAAEVVAALALAELLELLELLELPLSPLFNKSSALGSARNSRSMRAASK